MSEPVADKSISVSIRLLGFLEPYAHNGRLVLKAAAGSTVEEVIQNVVAYLGEDFRHALLDSHGNLNGGIEIVLEREQISAYRLRQTFLHKDSELLFLPMIAGGSRDTTERLNWINGGHNV